MTSSPPSPAATLAVPSPPLAAVQPRCLDGRCRLSLARLPPPPLIVFQTVFFLSAAAGGGETNEPACMHSDNHVFFLSMTVVRSSHRFLMDSPADVAPVCGAPSPLRRCFFFFFFPGISVVVALPAERLIGFLVPHLTCGVRRIRQSSLQCCIWR